MIRTRDFCLFLLTVLFLVGGISVSIVRGVNAPGEQTAAVFESVRDDELLPPASDHTVTVTETSQPDRPGFLSSMRAKIAALGHTIVAKTPEPTLVPEGSPSTTAAVTHGGEEAVVAWTCASVRSTPVPSLLGASFKETEGALIVYRPGATEASLDVDMGTTTAAVATMPISNDIILLQLPLRTSPAASPSCLPYDVVGIASDGSLIRNDEQGLYSVFGESTQIGYALDGFPIYGRNDNVVTDRCGGAVVLGTYRYYLSTDREAVLGCFSGTPVAL